MYSGIEKRSSGGNFLNTSPLGLVFNNEYFSFAKDYFKSYITDTEFREIIEKKKYALLNTNPNGDVYRKLTAELRTLIPQYIKENISLNKFTA